MCVIEADSLQLRVITVGLYLFLSRSLLCQILAVFAVLEFNSIQDYLYSAFYDTIVAKQLYRKLSFLIL